MPSKKNEKPGKGEDKPNIVEEKRQRHPFLYIFSLLILVIIVVTFIGTPAVRNFTKGGGPIQFGSYGNRDIEYAEGNFFARQQEIIGEQMRSSDSKENIDLQLYRVWRAAFERTAFHAGIMTGIERSGAYVTEQKLNETLTQYPGYMENGKFSEVRYRNTPARTKYANRNYIREMILHDTFLQDTILQQKISSAEGDFVKGMASPERQFRYVTYSYEDYPDSRVTEYGKANSRLFRQAKLSRITIHSSEADAKDVRRQVEENVAGFEDLARSQSQDVYAETGGDMGWQNYFELQGDFSDPEKLDQVFSLDKGAVSEVLETSFGWVIYRLDEEIRTPDFASQDVIAQVRAYMERFERGMIEDYLVEQAQQLRQQAVSAGFADAAASADLEVSETDYFPINYGGLEFLKPAAASPEQAPAIAAAAGRQAFFETAFALDEGALSEPVLAGDYVLVLQLAGEREPAEKELEFFDSYYSFFARQFVERDVQTTIMSSEKLKDNFNQTFMKVFLSDRKS